MRLIIRLVLQLVGIAFFCLTLTAGWVMADAHRSVENETAASAERVAHELESLFWSGILWRQTMRRDNVLPIPDWESLKTLKLISPGVCISYAPGGEDTHRLCSQLEGVGAEAPAWFSRVYENLFGSPAPVRRPLTMRQPETGAVLAVADSGAAVRQAWRQISVVVSVAALMAVGICLLAAIAIAYALAPTLTIIDSLRRLESGDYGHRIGAFTTSEFGMIGRAVNDLAGRLAQITAERAALTKRLFEVQEQERRALARDLHDEFGQSLAATLAFAGSIEAGAGDRPDLAEDARAISRVARGMMSTLRNALSRLRSQELDELGLETCLAQLVAGWNAQTSAKPVVRLDLIGDLSSLPQTIAVSVYRIAQECLTNAIRHGAPGEVLLRVERSKQDDALALLVEDDGVGDPLSIDASKGHGILGVRERVDAFGGSLSIGRAAKGGVRVAAQIPLTPTLASP